MSELAVHDAAKDGGVDVPARQDDADALAAQCVAQRERRGDAERAGAFDEIVGQSEEKPDGVGDARRP